MITDIVIGLQHGDEGKGKVTHHLLKSGKYTHCVRFNGGCNAGHTIIHRGKKFVTHHIPAGVFFGVTSVIGNGLCGRSGEVTRRDRLLRIPRNPRAAKFKDCKQCSCYHRTT